MNLIKKLKTKKPIYQNEIAIIKLPMNINIIVDKVCAGLGTNKMSLKGRCRDADLVLGRFTIAVLAKRHSGLILEHIGQAINRDHSTIKYYLKKARVNMPYNRRMREFVKLIDNQL